MRKIIALAAICFWALSCSDSDTKQAYDPGKSVAARPVIMAPSGNIAFRMSGRDTNLDDQGGHICENGFSIKLTSVQEIRLRIAGDNGSQTFTVDTQDRPGASPVQESLTLSVVNAETGRVLFGVQNASKSGDDLFVFQNIDVTIPTADVDQIFIRVRNDIDKGIWSGYIHPAWTVTIDPAVDDRK